MSYVQKWLWSCVSTLIGSVVCKVRDNIWPCPLSSVRGWWRRGRCAVPGWPLRAEGESAGKLLLSQVINNCSEDNKNKGHSAPTCCTSLRQSGHMYQLPAEEWWSSAQLNLKFP